MDIMEGMERLLRQLGELLKGLAAGNVSFNFGSGAAAVAAYIFMSLGLYAIARSRRIPNPWLAWVPLGNLWILGSIADQYRYVTRGEDIKRRKRMLVYGIVELGIVPIAATLVAGWVIAAVAFGVTEARPGLALALLLLGMLVLLILLAVVLVVVAIMLQVQRCYAFYELFSSCVPQRRKLYSALSIVASCLGTDLVAAIFIFLCRDKEEGMPPRIEE